MDYINIIAWLESKRGCQVTLVSTCRTLMMSWRTRMFWWSTAQWRRLARSFVWRRLSVLRLWLKHDRSCMRLELSGRDHTLMTRCSRPGMVNWVGIVNKGVLVLLSFICVPEPQWQRREVISRGSQIDLCSGVKQCFLHLLTLQSWWSQCGLRGGG